MSFFTTQDGTRLYYTDGSPDSDRIVVFSHGWPLSSDAWDAQRLFLGQQGYRVIAHDRRGHGRSESSWSGNTMDQYADDLAELLNTLNVQNAVLVGHSTGGGEVARYIGRHGTARVAKAVLLGAVPPIMRKSDHNPGGLPISVFDDIRKGVAGNRSQFFQDLAVAFYGFNKSGAAVSQGLIDSFWRLGMQSDVKGCYDCIEQFSETDFTDDLKKFDIPTLIAHGDADQIVPIGGAALLSSKLVPGAQLKIYEGAPHGLAQTLPDSFNADLLAFIEG